MLAVVSAGAEWATGPKQVLVVREAYQPRIFHLVTESCAFSSPTTTSSFANCSVSCSRRKAPGFQIRWGNAARILRSCQLMLVLVIVPDDGASASRIRSRSKTGASRIRKARTQEKHSSWERLRARAGARAGWSRPAFGPERLRAAFAIWGNHLRRLSGERNLTRARLRLRWSITSKRSAMGGSVGFLLS